MLKFLKRFKKEKKEVVKINLTTSKQDHKHVIKHVYDKQYNIHDLIDAYCTTNLSPSDYNFFTFNRGLYNDNTIR